MKPIATLDIANGGLYFSIIYCLSFFVCIIVVFISARRRNLPPGQSLLLICSGMFFFILGNKALAFSPDQWTALFNSRPFEPPTRMVILGGFIGLLLGTWIAKKALRISYPVMDLLAVALPLSMAIQRVGCLLAGCCHGKPTSLPWGIAYGPQSHAFQNQLDQGLIHYTDMASLPVHPTQLYQVIFCLLIAFIVWKTRKKWKSRGSLLLFSILLYGIFRFLNEFVREPATGGWMGEVAWGLKYAQWFVLGGTILLTGILLIKERYFKGHLPCNHLFSEHPGVNFLFAMFLLFSIMLLNRFFSPVEWLVIVVVTIPAIIKVSGTAFIFYFGRTARWVTPSILLAGLLLMGQSYIPQDEKEKVTFTELGVAGMYARYSEVIRQFQGEYPSDCGGVGYMYSEPKEVRYSNYQGGFQVSYVTVKDKYTRSLFRGSAFVASDRVYDITNSKYYNETTFGFSPYMQFDWLPVGFGIGVQFGRFRYAELEKNGSQLDRGDWENATNEYNIFIQQHLRFGPYHIAFVEGNLSNFFPSGTPMPLWSIGLGTGLGRVDGTRLVTGFSDAGIYMEGVLPFRERYLLTGFAAYNFKQDLESRTVLSLGFRYRFNFKTALKNKYKVADNNQ
jgi:prolipoprotein diacylglyceryltransferase